MFFFCGSDIGKDFPIAKDLSENPADTGIIITNLFIGKRKICFNRKMFSMFGSVEDLIAMGYSGNLEFERDFLGEGLDMINNF